MSPYKTRMSYLGGAAVQRHAFLSLAKPTAEKEEVQAAFSLVSEGKRRKELTCEFPDLHL